MAKKKRIEKWVEIPIHFWVSAKDEAVFDKAVGRIPKEIWMDISSPDEYRIQSESARRWRQY